MEVTEAFSVVVDCELAPAASVDAEVVFACAAGEGTVVAATSRSPNPLTDGALAAGLTL